MHAIIHFDGNVHKPTFKTWMDRFIGKHYKKDEGVVKYQYDHREAVDVRTCYCIKDEYLSKHDTSTHYVGIGKFDLNSATDDLPDETLQTTLQNTKSDRLVNAVWISNIRLWKEYSPDDSSIRSCIDWYNHSVNEHLIEYMPDPRKQTQFIEGLYRIRNKLMTHTTAQARLIPTCEGHQQEEKTVAQVYKSLGKKRKYGV